MTMTHEFPADVVKTTDKFATELGQFNGLNVDDIAQLWRAYTTQSTVVQDGVVSRLENLFWRIWGNVALQQSLTGITLATLFMAIHENSSLHLTHRQLSISETAESPPVTSSTTEEAPLTIITISPKTDEKREETSPKKEPSKSPLPPILKKSGEGKKSQPPTAPSSYKATRILIPDKPSQRTPKEVTKDTAAENGKATKSPTTTTATASQKSTRKKTTFVANRSASSKRRGVLIRRKSAQTSPAASPAIERSEESLLEQGLQEEIQTPKDEQRDEQDKQEDKQLEKAGTEGPVSAELSWRSLSYLKLNEDNTAVEQEPARSGTSPPPTNFSLSSVRHHRSPEDHHRVASQETTDSPVISNKPLVDQSFRTTFIQRRSAHGTTNNSTASSLTTGLSSTNLRELLNAAEAATTAMKNTNNNDNDSLSPAGSLPAGARYLLPKPDSLASATTVTSPTRTSDRNRRPMITSTQQKVDTELVSRRSSAVSGSVTLTSQHTSGVFSVPKDSQGQLGEQLSSLIKGVKDSNKTRRGKQ